MAFYTANTYSEAVNGDFVYANNFGPVFGTGTTISGTASLSDADSFYYDISGTGLENTEHPRTLPKGSTQPLILTVSGRGNFIFVVSDSQGNSIYDKYIELTSTPVTITGSFVVTNSPSNFRTYVLIQTFDTTPANLSYTLNVGTTPTPTPPSNRNPIAVDDSVNGIWGTPLIINALFNDRDPDGDTLRTSILTPASRGSVVQNPNNTFTYTPADGFVGTDSFVYIITDGRGGTSTARVTIEILPGEKFVNLGNVGPGNPFPTQNPTIPPSSSLVYQFTVATPMSLFGSYYSNESDTPSLRALSSNIAPTMDNIVDNYGAFGFGSGPRAYDTPLMPGTYQVAITSNQDQVLSTAFEGRMVLDGAGNAPYWAKALGVPQANTSVKATDFVSRVDDSDYYSFDLLGDSAVAVTLVSKNSQFSGVPKLYVDGNNGFVPYLIPSATQYIYTLTTASNHNPLKSGRYYLEIEGFKFGRTGFNGDEEEYYTVYASAWSDNAGNAFASARALGNLTNLTSTRSDTVGIADPNDYYSFTLTTQSVVRLSLADQNSRMTVNMQLFNERGVPIVTDYGIGGTDARSVLATLDPGFYYVRAYMPDVFPLFFGSYGNGFDYPGNGAATYQLTIQASSIASGAVANLDGGVPSETINGGDGPETISGNGGNDVVYGNGGNDILNGNEGSDQLYGGAGNDRLFGGAGNDQLSGGAGADYLDGGDGFNYGSYVEAPVGVYASLLKPAANTGHAAGDTYFAIQGLLGTQFADVLVGNEFANVLTSGEGDDILYGFGGADELNGDGGTDQLYGGDGGDRLNGGAGFDYARYDFSPAGVVVRLDYGQSSGGDAAGDIFIAIEGLVGSSAPDTLIGDGQGNILNGLAGNDRIFGQGGDDQLYGGAGIDQIIGGSGADHLSGGIDNDQFYFLNDDFSAGIWDRIIDFGESGANFDYLRFENFSRTELIFAQNGADAVVTTTGLKFAGGLIIQNFNALSLVDQIIYA